MTLRPHPLDCGHPPPWATSWGEDRFGVFAGFSVGEVEQRMRWIPDGRFVMGSPEDEPGRFDREVQHEVEVTQGFWIADTPCTQELWQAVMGENPSHFKSPRRPVEHVSWEDVGGFCDRLGERVPHLNPRLPTEAEWEYACRAQIEKATYAGPMEILGANDAPVLDPIAWYGGNSGQDFDLEEGWDSSDWPEKQYPHVKAGTRLVATRRPNPWGLFDMLGNVYEWCEDWYGPYSDEVKDLAGSRRVFRGGSWSSDAQSVRAAYRFARDPSYRWSDLGFRLARGPK